jgi:hypothetical protein
MPFVWVGGEWAIMNPDRTPRPIGAAYVEAIQIATGPQLQGLGRAAVRNLPSRARGGRKARQARARKARQARARKARQARVLAHVAQPLPARGR